MLRESKLSSELSGRHRNAHSAQFSLNPSVYGTHYSTRLYCHSMAHRTTWLAFRLRSGLRRRRRLLLCSVLAFMCSFRSGALGGGEEQGRQWTLRLRTVNKDRAAMWWWVYGGKKGQLWWWTSSTVLRLNTLCEWAGGRWMWQQRWRWASVSL